MKIEVHKNAFGKKAFKVMNFSKEGFYTLIFINFFGIGIFICDR